MLNTELKHQGKGPGKILLTLPLLLFVLLSPASCKKNSNQPIVQPSSACGSSDGICPSGCTFYEDSDCPKCNSTVGLTAPVRPCSPQFKCVNLLGTYPLMGITEITAPSDVPTCATHETTPRLLATGCYYGGRGAFADSRFSWTDADGTARYWCEFRPAGTLSTSKRPLLIFVHGSGGNADDIYDNTELRTKAADYNNLSGDAGRPGYILVSVQGRNLHWPTADPEEGSKHDSYHRNPATNRDVAFFDHLIDSLVAEGVADPKRIYLTGWSNGARFSAYYGIARHESPTPGGNRVAAIAPYSGGDPFENIASGQAPSCKQDPYPATTLPFFLISRNCDGIACSQEQFDSFTLNGWTMTPGNQAEAWLSTLLGPMGDSSASWIKIGYFGATVTSCLSTTDPVAPCTTSMALRNHFCWPDGVSDGGGNDREPDMLEFLKANPLP